MSSDPRRRPPAALPPSLGDLLATFRETESLPAAARERIWSTVAAPEPPRRRFAAEHAAPTQAGRRWAVVAALAAAGVAALWLASAGEDAVRIDDGDSRHGAATMVGQRAMQPGTVLKRGVATGGVERTPVVTPTAAATQAGLTGPTAPVGVDAARRLPWRPSESPKKARREPNRRPPRGGRAERGHEDRAVAAAGPSALVQEQRLVARAWNALTGDDPGRALSIARSHASRFPDGILGPERDAVIALARCRAEPDASAVILTRYRSKHADSPLAARVTQGCGAAEEKTTPP